MRFRHAFAILKTGCELWRAGRDMALASSSVLRGEITAVDGQQKAAAKGTTSTSCRSHLPTILQLGGAAMQDPPRFLKVSDSVAVSETPV